MSETPIEDVTRVISADEHVTVDAPGVEVTPAVQRGEAVGRYIVIDEIGRGGMGVVYSAYDPELDRKVALKLLKPKASSRDGLPRARERLAREAQTMAKLAHGNVVRVFDVGTHGDRVFVALEFIDGETLGRWMKRERRPWREVLSKFILAGRGLAAAHAEGLIHRDFKPENVMIDARGQVRVMDFGLALPTSNTLSSPGAPEAEASEPSEPSADVEVDLTATGVVLGTPAYMSPEQIVQGSVDARADQFSYCVALFEALFGQRPFAGKTMNALQRAITKTDPNGRADGTVPGWLRRAVIRGLRPKPAERWPSMNVLLDVLERSPEAGQRRVVLLGAVLTAGAVGAAGWGLFGDVPRDPCEAVAGGLESVWTQERRAAAAGAFEATSLPYAAEAWSRADQILAEYADGWVAARRDACEANKVRGEESEVLFDRRMACLDGRRAALTSQLEVFERADPTVVERAFSAASSLPPLERCSNASVLLADVAPPQDPAVAAAADAVRADLAEVNALRNAGLIAEADAAVDPVMEAATESGYAPIRAEVMLGMGLTRFKAGRMEDARVVARDVVVLAEQLGMDDLAARSQRLLVEVLIKTADHDEALMLARLAFAKLDRLDASTQDRANMFRTRALLHDARGDYDAAKADHERWEELLGTVDEDPLVRAQAMAGAGRMAFRAHDYATARERFADAADASQSALGALHPEVARMLGNAAIAAHAGGHHEEAEALQTQSLTMLENALGPEHPDLALTTTNLGSTKMRLGKLDEALALQRRSVAIRVKAYGPEHGQVGRSMINEATVLSKMRRHEEALDVYLDAVRILENGYGPTHPILIDPLLGLGETFAALDRPADAAKAFRRSLDLSLEGKEPAIRMAPIQLGLAQALIATRGDEAREEALTLARSAHAAFVEAEDRGIEKAQAVLEALGAD